MLRMNIEECWGYGAVVIPRKLAWQGFQILEPSDPSIHAEVAKAIAYATQLLEQGPPRESLSAEGILSACLMSAMEDGNVHGVAVFATALSEEIGCRFWVVDGIGDSDGAATTVTRLAVDSAAAARDQINARVLPLRMGQVLQMMRER